MKVKSFRPRIQITVYRNGRPVDYASARVQANYRKVWALEDMLGDGTSVIVQKSIRATAGTFQITVADNPVNNTADTFYANVAPMDFLVIEMAHEAGPLTVVMRGFVSSIERHNAIGHDGRPNNTFVIKGGDFGKLADQYMINWLFDSFTGAALMRAYALFTQYGIGTPVMSAREFYTALLDEVYNPYLRRVLVLQDNPHGHDVVPEISEIDAGVQTQGIQQYVGSLWNLMAMMADLAWHELYFEDREDGVYLVYRPLPYYGFDEWTESGGDVEALSWIEQPGFVRPDFIFRSHDVMQSLSSYRSDADVANLFSPAPVNMSMMFDRSYRFMVLDAGGEWADQRQYPHSHVDLFSEKLMEPTIQHVMRAMTTSPNSLPAEELQALAQSAPEWLNRRREFLARANRDNAVWESGAMTLFGDPAIKAGRYLVMDRGLFRFVAYAHTVTHVFQPYQSYTTIVQFDRGTGWVARQRLETNPALTERAPTSAWEI